jgi:predicted TIM-barrel fold metal-dependent hydrolase
MKEQKHKIEPDDDCEVDCISDADCLAFDKNPHKPLSRLPRGSCDAHCHVFEDRKRYPFSSSRSYTPPHSPLKSYLEMARCIGFTRAVFVQPSVYGLDNRAMLSTMSKYGDNSRGIVVIDEGVSDCELEAFHVAGIRGARFNTLCKGGVSIDKIEAIAAKISKLGWHLQLFVPVDDMANNLGRLSRLPLNIVFDHIGHPNVNLGTSGAGFSSLLRLMETGKIWVKLSGFYRMSNMNIPYPDVTPFIKELIQSFPERLVWGSDWPHTEQTVEMPNDGDLCNLLFGWVSSNKILKDILVKGPEKLYGFSEKS